MTALGAREAERYEIHGIMQNFMMGCNKRRFVKPQPRVLGKASPDGLSDSKWQVPQRLQANLHAMLIARGLSRMRSALHVRVIRSFAVSGSPAVELRTRCLRWCCESPGATRSSACTHAECYVISDDYQLAARPRRLLPRKLPKNGPVKRAT